MKRLLFLVLLIVLQTNLLKAQIELEWARQIGGSTNCYGKSLTTDADGNLFINGYLGGSANFNSLNNPFNLNSGAGADVYVAKYTSNNSLEWAFNISGSVFNDIGNSIIVDSNNDLIITGNIESLADFDPSSNNVTINTFGYSDVFLAKYSTDGNFIWAFGIGNTGYDKSYSVITDNQNNIYITGSFQDTVDFDPGIGIVNLVSNGNSDVFIAKYNANGSFIWANNIGGSGDDIAYSFIKDSSNNIYVTGEFTDTADFNPNYTPMILTSNGSSDIFLLRINEDGESIWAFNIGGSNDDAGYFITNDFENSIYITGFFQFTVDFNPSTPVFNLSGVAPEPFVAKFDSLGNLIWAIDLVNSGFSNDHGNSIKTDKTGNVYLVGDYATNIDLDPSTNNHILTGNGAYDIFLSKYTKDGNFLFGFSYGGQNVDFGNCLNIDKSNNIYLIGSFTDTVNFNPNSSITNLYSYATSAIIVKLNQRGINGNLFIDINEDCLKDNEEIGISNLRALINPGNFIVESSNLGIWHLDSLPTGNYTITVDTSGHWQPTCPTTQSFTVINPDSITIAPSFGFISNQPCAAPSVSVQMPFMRPCFTNQLIYVQACNTNLATGVLTNGYVELELDSLLTPTSSSIPYTSLGNNMYSFDVGTLNPGQCANFTVSTTLSCSATFGQTLCMQANLYPADSCVFDQNPTPPVGGVEPCTLPWDNSSLSVEGWCQNDTLYFSVTNTGDFPNGNMQCFSPVRVFVDGVLTYLDSVLLTGGQTTIFSYFGNGQTWTLQADQHPLHPGNSHPNASVEACGDSTNWTSGLVNTLPLDDADPVVDIYCGVVTGSYDPNDKTGYPLGVGNDHFVAPNGKIDYVIRFQNTGTDTAFTVVVRDTLDIDLDIFSVQSGVSSHDYTFKMFGPRVLEWTFNNILLPDSTTDQAGSNGFVTFTVNQNPDLADGTVVNNSASIYFDFNAPIFTNTTSHIINRGINYLLAVKEAKNINNNSLFIYPNPTKNILNIVVPDAQVLKIEVYTVDGKLIERKFITKNTTVDVSKYQSGLYFINATNSKGEVFRNKFVKE